MFQTRSLLRTLLALSVVTLLSACAAPHEERPKLSFAGIEPTRVAVAQVNVDSRFTPGADGKDVSGEFPVPLDEALRRYGQYKFLANGATGDTLRVTVEDAHVFTHEAVPGDSKVAEWLRVIREEKHEAFVKLRVAVFSPEGTERVGTVVTVFKTLGIPDNVSLAERDRRRHAFVEAILKDVDAVASQSVRNNLNISEAPGGVQPESLNRGGY